MAIHEHRTTLKPDADELVVVEVGRGWVEVRFAWRAIKYFTQPSRINVKGLDCQVFNYYLPGSNGKESRAFA